MPGPYERRIGEWPDLNRSAGLGQPADEPRRADASEGPQDDVAAVAGVDFEVASCAGQEIAELSDRCRD